MQIYSHLVILLVSFLFIWILPKCHKLFFIPKINVSWEVNFKLNYIESITIFNKKNVGIFNIEARVWEYLMKKDLN